MKKAFLALPIMAAIILGGLTGCIPDPTIGVGTPSLLQSNPAVETVDIAQPETIAGSTNVLYIVRLKSSLNAEQFAEVADDVTKELVASTEDNEEWSIKFRSGNREIGMSQIAFLEDNPSLIKTPIPSPTPTEGEEEVATEAPPEDEDVVDSYTKQIAVINELFSIEGTVNIKTFDGFASYVDVSITQQERFEEFFEASKVALDNSGWKHRGDFKVQFTLVTETSAGVVKPTGVTFTSSVDISVEQTAGLGGMLAFPESAVAMYRTLLTLPNVSFKTIDIAGRNVGEDIDIVISGGKDVPTKMLVANTMNTVQTEDAQYVRVNIRTER